MYVAPKSPHRVAQNAILLFLGRIPTLLEVDNIVGSRPNDMCVKSLSVRPSIRPQKVSLITMKFGIPVVPVRDAQRYDLDPDGSKVKVTGTLKLTNHPNSK